MQAIHTKYIPATDTKAAKIKAYNESHPRGVTVSIDYDLDDVGRHFKAAQEFVKTKLSVDQLAPTMAYGGSADGKGYVFCFVDSLITLEV
jgi:hypothetical protein